MTINCQSCYTQESEKDHSRKLNIPFGMSCVAPACEGTKAELITSYCSYARSAQPGPYRTRLCGPCIAAKAGLVMKSIGNFFTEHGKIIADYIKKNLERISQLLRGNVIVE